MRLNHPDYIKLVIGTYKKKRANNELSRLLSQPTPANIRQECSNVYQERYEKKDAPALRAFFGLGEHGEEFLEIIENFDLPKFKPLDLYLKKDGKKGITDKSLEVLAWLIDLRHRPFVFGKEVILNEEEILIIADENYKVIDTIESEDEEEEESEHPLVNEPAENPDEKKSVLNLLPDVPKNNKEEDRPKKALVFFLLLIIGAVGLYTIWQKQQDKQLVMGNANTGCMYWAGNRYEPISCTENRSDRLVLPMDSERMKNFKRITREDTITEKSIGKIYYIRINGGREYYTAGGNHPVEVTRTLKKLSRYMFDEHLRKQEVTTKIP